MAEWRIEVDSEADQLGADLSADLERAARTVLAAEGAGDVALSVALVSDETIHRLNEQYLAHDHPTDVIAFPLRDPGGSLVGDIYIGVAQAERQAADLGIALREELLRLVVHGTLHVLGWEHPEEGGRGESPMYVRQEELVVRLGNREQGTGNS